MSVCLSVCLSIRPSVHMKQFYTGTFLENRRENWSLLKIDKNNDQFTCRRHYILIISHWILHKKNKEIIRTKIVEKIKMQNFLFKNVFPKIISFVR